MTFVLVRLLQRGSVRSEHRPARIQGTGDAIELEVCRLNQTIGTHFEEMESFDFLK